MNMKPQELIPNIEIDKNKPGIYMIYNAISGKAYIGQTKRTLHKRISSHRYELKGDRHNNPYLQHAYNKYGLASFMFIPLENCEIENLTEREAYYLSQLDLEIRYNLGPVTSSNPMSQDQRDKISNAHKGKVISQETREKLRQANLGKKASEETRAKLSKIHKGRKMSEENRLKVIERSKGRVISEETREKMRAAKLGTKRGPMSEEQKVKLSIANKGNCIGRKRDWHGRLIKDES